MIELKMPIYLFKEKDAENVELIETPAYAHLTDDYCDYLMEKWLWETFVPREKYPGIAPTNIFKSPTKTSGYVSVQPEICTKIEKMRLPSELFVEKSTEFTAMVKSPAYEHFSDEYQQYLKEKWTWELFCKYLYGLVEMHC